MELKEAREIADKIRGTWKSISSIPNGGEIIIILDNRITELEKQIKNDIGYREMKTLYNQIVKENKDNYEKRRELEADVGSEKEISKLWRDRYNGLCPRIHEAVAVGKNQERDYPENELKKLVDRAGKAEAENIKLRELGNEAVEEQHDRAERLEAENTRLHVLIKEAHESVEELHGRTESLQKQLNVLLAACEAALEKCPFPVGAMKVKQQLKDAILKLK